MKKLVFPTILILIMTSIISFLVIREFSSSVRSKNPVIGKLEGQNGQAGSTADETDVLSKDRLTANDTCILIKKNIDNRELVFRNILGGKDKSLFYDGTTVFLSKNEEPLVAQQLSVGDILDVTFTTYDAKIKEARPSASIWEHKDITKFRIDEKKRTIQIGDSLYMLNKGVVVASDDKIGEVMDVTNLDNICVKGIDKEIYSIQIDKGHGYIRVLNDTYFVGGWIEIGQDIIRVLSEDMLIPVPEGRYAVKVTNRGYVGKDTITVKRDKESRLDLSKVEIEEVAIGHVLFKIIPDYAQLYVDGLITDFEERIPLEYGIHSVRAELAGYETVYANIRVGSEFADISIELDEDPDQQSYDKDDDDNDNQLNYSTSSSASTSSSSMDTSSSSSTEASSSSTENSSSDSSSSSSSSTSTTVGSSTVSTVDTILSDNKKLHVQSPNGVEVYFDGKYIGIAPCSTQKIVGDHTITLSKDGYNTKSYTINITNDGNDLTMSFSELTKTE